MINIHLCDTQNQNGLQNLSLQPEVMPNNECLIGRSLTAGLILEGIEVSRFHAKICCRDHKYYFLDLDSRGGSLVNDQAAVANQEYLLKPGDVLAVGRFILNIIQVGNPDVDTLVVPKPQLKPEQYMPVATIEPAQIGRWQKGELTVRCAEIIDETHDVKTFRFVTDPPLLFSYKPGQFVTLVLEINGEEVLRSYSISSTPSRPHSLEITVKRVPAAASDLPPGLVSNWLHDNVKVGSAIKLSGPLGKFSCFQHPSRKLLFISGGSGITPMMGMSRWLCDTVADCNIVFLHSARTPADVIYQQELMLMSSRHPKFRPIVTVTQWQSGQGWLGLTGRLNPNMMKSIIPDFLERMIFVCGPEAFMQATKEMMASLSFPMDQYHEESFGGAKFKKVAPEKTPEPSGDIPQGSLGIRGLLRTPVATPPAMAIEAATPALPAVVKAPVASSQTVIVFQKSAQQVSCDGDESILDIADQNGVKIRSSCRSGNCGTCKKKKISGTVKMGDFDPEALDSSEVEEGFILTCVAFPEGQVVIDA